MPLGEVDRQEIENLIWFKERVKAQRKLYSKLTEEEQYKHWLRCYRGEEDMFFERNQYSLLTGIWEMIKGNEKGRQKVNQALQICQQLGATKYHKMNHDLLRNVERIYEIDF